MPRHRIRQTKISQSASLIDVKKALGRELQWPGKRCLARRVAENDPHSNLACIGRRGSEQAFVACSPFQVRAILKVIYTGYSESFSQDWRNLRHQLGRGR
jgi:hypothetical protein